MTDKVQKIREEVERLRVEMMGIRTDFADGQKSVLTKLLAYIDTMQEELVSEELEKAAVEAFKEIVDDGRNSFLEIFKAGAKWQKEQMMKEAIDGTARPDDNEIWCNLSTFNFKDGDKCKMILINEG